MSSIFDNPTFYVSIFSSGAFIISEILPFLPIKSNGLVHAILEGIISYKGYKAEEKDDKKEQFTDGNKKESDVSLKDVNNKLDIILEKLNSNYSVVPIFSA